MPDSQGVLLDFGLFFFFTCKLRIYAGETNKETFIAKKRQYVYTSQIKIKGYHCGFNSFINRRGGGGSFWQSVLQF